ncbi:hypothetical protein DENSPDRAFT_837812 [Dentipellis sp. KUC8613]|nr:hypothetical protein DENSPDRAFT_837812 [Dentipellis sp. KUC8613]
MTRYTNLGRKRTYVEAGFNYHEPDTEAGASTSAQPEEHMIAGDIQDGTAAGGEPQKAKRKRNRKGKGKAKAEGAEGEIQKGDDEATEGREHAEEDGAEGKKEKSAKSIKKSEKARKFREKQKLQQKARRIKDAEDRAAASERRRLKRIAERHANITCFACREAGHAAADCPNIKLDGEADGEESGRPKKGTREMVGICYRCGSQKHTLSRCRKTVNPENPMPYASCFVCSGKGHLASACPQNKNKGIYPNGGCCKLCGETDHLAKNCGLRKEDVAPSSVFVGFGQDAGADEDDFITFKRKNAEVDREVHIEGKMKKMAKVRVGAHSGVVKAFGSAPVPKAKVVVF